MLIRANGEKEKTFIKLVSPEPLPEGTLECRSGVRVRSIGSGVILKFITYFALPLSLRQTPLIATPELPKTYNRCFKKIIYTALPTLS